MASSTHGAFAVGPVPHKVKNGADKNINAPTPEQLAELVTVSGDVPVAARRGKLGLCGACREPVASHWDDAGRFLGCAAAGENTVFVLWPVKWHTSEIAPQYRPREEEEVKPAREFVRARYASTLPDGTDLDALDLSDHRRKVLKVIHAAPAGIIARDIIKESKLPHGSVQQALSWLRERQLITATEDDK
jgi:hypothetical protein